MAAGDKDSANLGPKADSASSARRDPLIGAVVNGKYRVHSAIARGGMGRIYYATQVPLERPVALKVVQGDGDHEHESQFLKRFLQEASILAKLQHPNVVTLFDYGKIEGAHVEQYFIAMEFLAGDTLTQRLKIKPRLSVPETLVLGRQIARGLREAHKRGIVHRDLKPSNIILVPEGDGSEIVKLVDFGIGKVLGRPGDAQDLTQDGVFVGTPRYMAPEQFEGTAFPASDLYALGTIMFQCLAGRLPFAGATMSDFMVAKLARTVPLIREVAPDAQVPECVEVLVQHLLGRKPEERPSMEELQAHFMTCEEEVFGTPHSLRHGNSSGPHAFARTGTGRYAMPTGELPPASSSGPQLPPPSSVGWVPSGGQLTAAQAAESYAESLRVPPTVVTAMPSSTPMPRSMPSGHEAQTQVEALPPRRTSKVALVAFLVLLFACTIVGALFVRKRLREPIATTPTATTPTTTAVTAATPPTAFTLSIDSQPSGATVSEGDKVLGETPLDVSIDHASVAAGPRTFVLKREGFAPSQVVQGASNEAVHSVASLAALAPEASSAVKSRPSASAKPLAQGPLPVKPPTSTASAGAAPAGPGLDIRLKR